MTYFIIPEWIMENTDLTHASKLVYSVLRSGSEAVMGPSTARISKQKIAGSIGSSLPTISRALTQLEALGCVKENADGSYLVQHYEPTA